MNRFDFFRANSISTRQSNRRSPAATALAAGGLVVAVALTGCGSGQLSQTASQESAVDGSQAVINNVALRNVRIQAAQTGDFLRPGATVDLGPDSRTLGYYLCGASQQDTDLYVMINASESDKTFEIQEGRPALRDVTMRWTDAYLEALDPLLAAAGSRHPRSDAELLLAAADGLLVQQLASDDVSDLAPRLRRLADALVKA